MNNLRLHEGQTLSIFTCITKSIVRKRNVENPSSLTLRSFIQKSLCSCLLLFFTSLCYGQWDFSDFGAFTSEEINYKECPFDKGADAVVFYDKAIAGYDDQYNLVTNRTVRFKILKEPGIKRGNIHIGFYSGDDFEFIRGIDAIIMSYDDQNNVVTNKIERKSIFTRKLNSVYSEVTFSMPNVKVGSIIEYRYESVMKNYGGLKNWIFQKEIPVLLSAYNLQVIPNAEFAYSVYRSSFMTVDVKQDSRDGRVKFIMQNIPGLRDEAYMEAESDYLQRVEFQLSKLTNYFGSRKISTTWPEASKDLLDDKDFGGAINKRLPEIPELKQLCEKASSPLEKMKAIHNYVRSAISWDNLYSIYSDEGPKATLEKKKGHGADIGLLLVNLLKSNGFEAYPLLVSERDHGRVDTTYPFLRQFNKVAAYVLLDGKGYILDGIDQETPSGTIPFAFLNTKAYLVDKKRGRFITIADSDKKRRQLISSSGIIDPSGVLRSQTNIYNYDYARISKEREYSNDISKYKEDYIKTYNLSKIDSFQLAGTDADSLPLTEKFQMTTALNKSGDYYLLNYNMFTGLDKNPFVSDHRFSNINYGCQHSWVLNEFFTLSDKMKVESLPKNTLIKTPDNSMALTRVIDQVDNQIRVQIKIDISRTEFEPEEYHLVKGFYKTLFDYLNEPIVLKAK